jgi:hypothetical protein
MVLLWQISGKDRDCKEDFILWDLRGEVEFAVAICRKIRIVLF